MTRFLIMLPVVALPFAALTGNAQERSPATADAKTLVFADFEKLKAPTSINLTAFCDQCELNKDGMVIVDNIMFEK